MSDYFRVALAANLNRSADTLERLAAKLTTAEPTQLELLEEMQVQRDAGAALWQAVRAGLLTVPEIMGQVEQLADIGYTEPDTATQNGALCANLFGDVMSDFIYPINEGISPYSCCADEDLPDTDEKGAMLRKNELQAEATGCRILAHLVMTQSPNIETAAATAPESAPAIPDSREWSFPATKEQWAERFGNKTIRTLTNWEQNGSLVWKLFGSNEWQVEVHCPRYVRWEKSRFPR